MPIKAKFNDTFLAAYLPAAQQAAHRYQQRQQFEAERADALARDQAQQAMAQQQVAFNQRDRLQGQQLQERQFEGLNLDRAQNRLGDIQTQIGQVDTRGRKEKAGQELKFMLQEMRAHPAIAGDAVLAPMLQMMEATATHPDVDPDQLLRSGEGIWKQAEIRGAAQQSQANAQAMFENDVSQHEAMHDAAVAMGDYERADEIRERIEAARTEFGTGLRPDKSQERYKAASKTLNPWRSGRSSTSRKSEPYAYQDAVKLAQGSIDKEDLKLARAAAKKAGQPIPTMAQMVDAEAQRIMAQVQSAQQQQQQGAGLPFEMSAPPSPNGQAQPAGQQGPTGATYQVPQDQPLSRGPMGATGQGLLSEGERSFVAEMKRAGKSSQEILAEIKRRRGAQ